MGNQEALTTIKKTLEQTLHQVLNEHGLMIDDIQVMWINTTVIGGPPEAQVSTIDIAGKALK